jgi:hypothetical protein
MTTQYDDDFPTCEETHAVLRIFSNEIQPDAITTLLNIMPSESFAKGDTQGDKGVVRKFNSWFLSSEKIIISKDTRRHIDWLVSKIGDKLIELNELKSKNAEIDISCLWISCGQGGPVLSPPQMKELGRLNLDVWWDVYFSNPEK